MAYRLKLPTVAMFVVLGAVLAAGLATQLAAPATSLARTKSCGSVRMLTTPAYRMRVKILRGNVSCRVAKAIIAGSVQPGPLAGFSCDDSPGDRPARITCSGRSVVDGHFGKFRARR